MKKLMIIIITLLMIGFISCKKEYIIPMEEEIITHNDDDGYYIELILDSMVLYDYHTTVFISLETNCNDIENVKICWGDGWCFNTQTDSSAYFLGHAYYGSGEYVIIAVAETDNNSKVLFDSMDINIY